MSTGKDLFEKALAAEGVTGKLADLSRSIYFQESGGGRNTKTSNADARGGMQIIPSTFNSVADKGWSIDDPEHNARAGIRYLKQLDKQAGGDPALTAAGYYGGPGGLEKARRGIPVSDPRNPNAPTTLEYGKQVVARMNGGAGAPPAPVQVAQAPVDVPTLAPSTQVAVAPQEQVLPDRLAIGGSEGDAWQTFLRNIPQQRQPVNVNDLQYGSVQPATQLPQYQFNTSVPQVTRPNFAAFGAWGPRGRTA